MTRIHLRLIFIKTERKFALMRLIIKRISIQANRYDYRMVTKSYPVGGI